MNKFPPKGKKRQKEKYWHTFSYLLCVPFFSSFENKPQFSNSGVVIESYNPCTLPSSEQIYFFLLLKTRLVSIDVFLNIMLVQGFERLQRMIPG